MKLDHLVKTVNFIKASYIGDPVNTVRIFNELEALENFNKAISLNNESYSMYYMRAICNASSNNPNRSSEKALSDVNEFLNYDSYDNAAKHFKEELINAGKKTIDEKGITLDVGGNQQQKKKIFQQQLRK